MEEAPKSENLTLEVTIPENSAAGDKITIQCPDNNFVEFVAPENVVAGDTVHVMVADTKDIEASSEQEERTEATASEEAPKTKVGGYQGVAAVTTGVIVSALVIGPVVTGVLVMGIVVCATQKSKANAELATPAATDIERMEDGTTEVEESPASPSPINNEPGTREQQIAAALVRTADYIADKWSALDERFAISGNTLKAIATVQEMDERNKITETVVTNIKAFDEKYQVSETAGNVVTTTVTKAKELDETCKLTENVTTAGSNLALCVTDFERRYDLSARITTALIYTMSTMADAITAYYQRLTNGPAATTAGTGSGTATTDATVELESQLTIEVPVDSAEASVNTVTEYPSPTEEGSYAAPAALTAVPV